MASPEEEESEFYLNAALNDICYCEDDDDCCS